MERDSRQIKNTFLKNGFNMTFTSVGRKPRRDKEVEKDTLQFILNKKKCTIPDDCIAKRKERENGKIIMVIYNKCKFRPDCMKFKNAYKHKIKEEPIKLAQYLRGEKTEYTPYTLKLS